jgi:hypothetical protein
MTTLLRRELTVDLPLEEAWRYLSQVERWLSWARHIKRIEVRPPGELGPHSTGIIHLRNGVKSTFSMTELNPYRNWKWAGPFLWLTVHYDHRFEAIGPGRTRLVWVVEASGFGVSVFGRLFAKIYNGNLDRAVPLLIEEMKAASA